MNTKNGTKKSPRKISARKFLQEQHALGQSMTKLARLTELSEGTILRILKYDAPIKGASAQKIIKISRGRVSLDKTNIC